ncbi:MAG: hypothetical protein ACJATV_000057 [Granulosicoccus sp.]|jgi:hypothetical protein
MPMATKTYNARAYQYPPMNRHMNNDQFDHSDDNKLCTAVLPSPVNALLVAGHCLGQRRIIQLPEALSISA